MPFAGVTPRESMPRFVQDEILQAPTTLFVSDFQASLFRGGHRHDLASYARRSPIAAAFFTIALLRFRKTVVQTA
jgi:ABC-2 type transport system permease protein